jgi:mRNA interferase MazF
VLSLSSIGKLPLRIVAPITDWQPPFSGYLWFVTLPADATNGLDKDSAADAFQVKSVSLNRFVRKLGQITDAQVEAIAEAVALCVGAP